jgi:hypothetical protein
MLDLQASSEARAELRKLKQSSPDVFAKITERITEVREDPGGKQAGRTFRTEDGETVHMATFYDPLAKCDVAVVWQILMPDGSENGVMRVVVVEHVVETTE